MSDFAQSGLICTLQRLNESHQPTLEADLLGLSEARPICLILPCHANDLDRPALAHIREEMRAASWLSEIVVSLNGLDARGMERAAMYFSGLPQKTSLLWTDGPRLAPMIAGLFSKHDPAGVPHGKGLNVWAALASIQAGSGAGIVATQDCDVSSFRAGNLARLCYACAHPSLDYAFAKMYYSRVTDRLYGRVSRLFLAPLLQAVLRVAGHHPLLDFLLSFRYPLAGEIAIRRDLANRLPLDPGWGLEIGMLCEIFRLEDPRMVAQVDGGSGYDHKHQPAATSLARMCREIATELFDHLRTEGVDSALLSSTTIADAYRKEAVVALKRSASLALINGLPFDQQSEREIVEAFTAELLTLPRPTSAKLPSIERLTRTQPEVLQAIATTATCL